LRNRPSLARRLAFVILFLVVGAAVLMSIAGIMDPPARCEERGGTWMIDGRYCEEAEAVAQ